MRRAECGPFGANAKQLALDVTALDCTNEAKLFKVAVDPGMLVAAAGFKASFGVLVIALAKAKALIAELSSACSYGRFRRPFRRMPAQGSTPSRWALADADLRSLSGPFRDMDRA